jgi:MinD-like ATPase involved in chromosome partitioning or flagellar assembly
VAAQIAWAAAQLGRKVLLVDADVAAASQHIILGAGIPAVGLGALLGREDHSAGAPAATRHPNLQLVASGRQQVRPESVGPAARLRLYERLRVMDAELAVVDVGAGLGYDAAALLELGDQRLVVATAQPASVNEAFALLKTLVSRTVRRHLARASQLGLMEPAVRTPEGEPVGEVLRRVHAVDPELAAQATESLDRFGAFLFGNQMQDFGQLGIWQSAVKTALDYLSIPLTLLGWLRAGCRLPELASVSDPMSMADSDESRLFRQVVGELLDRPPALTDLLHDELTAAVPAPPPLPVEALAQRGVPTPVNEPRKKAFVYVRPPRRKRTTARALDPEAQKYRRHLPLPGMPPTKVKN